MINMDDNELILNEASGINAGDLAAEDLPQNPTDGEWNDLYKKYLNPNNIKYYLITVNGFGRKNPTAEQKNEPAKGYIKYVGETGKEQGKVFKRRVKDTVDSNDITIVETDTDATAFKLDDLDKIVAAIKRNKDFNLRHTQFGRKEATTDVMNTIDYSNQIIMLYFNQLTGDNSAGEKLRPALGQLAGICRRRNYPLVGNPLFDMLKSILIANPGFYINGRSVITLNNIVADNVLKEQEIINPSSILGSLCYNNNLYNYNVTQIDKLFDQYDKAKNMKGHIVLPALRKYDDAEGRVVLAKNILLNASEAGAQGDILLNMISGKADKDAELPQIGYKPEGNVLTSIVRSPEQAEAIITTIFGTNKTAESDREIIYTLYVGSDRYEMTTLKVEDGIITGGFENVDLIKDASIKIYRSANKDNLLAEWITEHKKEINDKEANPFTVEGTVLSVKKTIKDVNIQVTISADRKGKNTSVKTFEIVNELNKQEEKEEPAEQKPAEEPKEETPAEENTNQKDRLDMSDEEFNNYLNSLTPEQVTQLGSKVSSFLNVFNKRKNK